MSKNEFAVERERPLFGDYQIVSPKALRRGMSFQRVFILEGERIPEPSGIITQVGKRLVYSSGSQATMVDDERYIIVEYENENGIFTRDHSLADCGIVPYYGDYFNPNAYARTPPEHDAFRSFVDQCPGILLGINIVRAEHGMLPLEL